jgi:hypothetical protein
MFIGIAISISMMQGGGDAPPDFSSTQWQFINFASWNNITTPWNI